MIRWRRLAQKKNQPSTPQNLGRPLIRVDDAAAHIEAWDRESLELLFRDELATKQVTEFHLILHGWKPITKRWSGKSGWVPGLIELNFVVGTDGPKQARIHMVSREECSVWEFARAAYPLLYPVRRRHELSSPRIALARSASGPLRFLGGHPMGNPIATEPAASTMLANDLVVASVDGQLDNVSTADTLRCSVIESRDTEARINLRLHNPRGRLDRWKEGLEARLSQAGYGALQLVTDDRVLKTFDTGLPLDSSVVSVTHKIEHVDLAGLQIDGLVGHRLAELAATGVVLHGLDAIPRVEPIHEDLEQLMRQPYGAPSWLERDARSQAQSRTAMREHAYQLQLSGDVHKVPAALPTVSILLSTRRPEGLAEVLAAIGRQTYRNFEVLIACHGSPAPDLSSLPASSLTNVADVFEIGADVVFGDVMAKLTARASGELLAKMDDDDLYGPEHLWDLVLAHGYSDAEIVGKLPDRVFFEAKNLSVFLSYRSEYYARSVAGGTMLMAKSDLLSVGGWRPLAQAVDKGVITRIRQDGGLIYATSSVGFVYVRHARGHTWAADEEDLLAKAVDTFEGVPELALGIGVQPDAPTQ